MKTIRIAVGRERRPKVNAVQEAVASFLGQFGPGTNCEVKGYEIESGVSHTPTSRQELMRGARQREEALRAKLEQQAIAADFFVGVEGGLEVVVEDGGPQSVPGELGLCVRRPAWTLWLRWER